MVKMKTIYYIVLGFFVVCISACSPAGGDHTGHEFMPDMAHSVAYEANVLTNYWANTFDKTSSMSKRNLSQPRLPVAGTVARGQMGMNSDGATTPWSDIFSGKTKTIAIPPNGHVDYPYGNNEEERARAMKEITRNPYAITAAGLDHGKQLFTIYCAICHGDGGAGDGYLVRDDGGKFPAQPAILTSDDFIKSSDGRYYHAIMYGKNVMGSYSENLTFEERWQVIHYIRSLQAKAKGVTYGVNSAATVVDTAKSVPQ